MPQAADITVDDASGDDILFTNISSSAMGSGVAEWWNKVGTIVGVFPKITTSARKTGNNSQKMQGKFTYPSSYTDAVTGLTQVKSAAQFNFDSTLPADFPEALKADYAALAGNIVKNAIITAQIKDAVPAT
jgi:alpha-acetolactate decarboxylase